MGIREEFQKKKKGTFRLQVGSKIIIMGGITRAEAEERIEEEKKQKGSNIGSLSELPVNNNIKNMEA